MFLNHIYLLPLFPAFGAAIMFFFGRRLQKATVNAVCVGAIGWRLFSLASRLSSTPILRMAPGGHSRRSSIPGWVVATDI